ncbi:hypothetical protein EVAR_51732_1 [Eumeta japonica]|uniref:Uncharacterized protein n=1 Tax=Eumeta variegata TaxID=151549 RepID=A0A4C1XI57_EUMVA|nr:hypothetical protein EVAR_51732_1 [Eumeta japonica]
MSGIRIEPGTGVKTKFGIGIRITSVTRIEIKNSTGTKIKSGKGNSAMVQLSSMVWGRGDVDCRLSEMQGMLSTTSSITNICEHWPWESYIAVESITGEERFLSGNHEMYVAAWDDLPLSGLTTGQGRGPLSVTSGPGSRDATFQRERRASTIYNSSLQQPVTALSLFSQQLLIRASKKRRIMRFLLWRRDARRPLCRLNAPQSNYDEKVFRKRGYRANACNGKVGKSHPRKSDANHFGDILKKGQISSTRSRRAYMKRLMDVSEAKEIYKDRTKLKSIISAHPSRK